MERYFNIEKSYVYWSEIVINYLPRIILSILIILLFSFIGKFVKKHTQKVVKRLSGGRIIVSSFLSSFVYAFFLIAGIFIALDILMLEGVVAKLIAGAGVLSIIAGFAFKDIASNAFAGLLVNFQRPFKEGDWVTLNGQYGTISNIGWISTTIKTTQGQEVYVPNQLIYSGITTNFSTYGKRMVVLKTGVSYGDDLEHVKRVALDEVKKVSGVLSSENVEFFFTDIGSSTYNFELRFWIRFRKQTDFLSANSEVIMRIKKRFEQENISIAYSVMTLDFGVKGGVNIFDKNISLPHNQS